MVYLLLVSYYRASCIKLERLILDHSIYFSFGMSSVSLWQTFKSSIIDYRDHDIRWRFWLGPSPMIKLLWTRYCCYQSIWRLIWPTNRQLRYLHCNFLTEPVTSGQTVPSKLSFISSFDGMTGQSEKSWRTSERSTIIHGWTVQLGQPHNWRT